MKQNKDSYSVPLTEIYFSLLRDQPHVQFIWHSAQLMGSEASGERKKEQLGTGKEVQGLLKGIF